MSKNPLEEGSSPQKVFIRTFGCQMNDRDSENMMGLLVRHNYIQTPYPEEADLILVNTCSIREHASQKAASQLGRFGKLKAKSEKKPIIGVTGCLAQQEGRVFLNRFPFVDFLIGPDAIPRLPQMVQNLRQGERVFPSLRAPMDIDHDLDDPVFVHEYLPYPVSRPQLRGKKLRVQSYVTISKGCDFRCTFCVVPHTRGPERSASPEEILAEVKMLVSQGVKEITFLGQNVNSYGKNFPKPFYFHELLHRVEREIPQSSCLARIRFTTSHPIDLSPQLMASFGQLPRLCKSLHLPVQAGDNKILRRMKRLYTIEDYRSRLHQLSSFVPDMSLSTDIIVGFPGESEEQFQRTLDLLEEVRYTNLYAFKFSVRPNTSALKLSDDVPEDVKDERLARVFQIQEKICQEQNRKFEGKEVEVLVEGENRNTNRGGFTGRTQCNRLVHFSTSSLKDLTGELVTVRIEKGQDYCLLGTQKNAS